MVQAAVQESQSFWTAPLACDRAGMVAEMERKFIRERQQAGIEAAKANGV